MSKEGKEIKYIINSKMVSEGLSDEFMVAKELFGALAYKGFKNHTVQLRVQHGGVEGRSRSVTLRF